MPNSARWINEAFERLGLPIALLPTPEGRRFRMLERSQDLRFPLRIMHGGLDGQGRPLIRSDGRLNEDLFRLICRHDVWSFQPTPIWDRHRAVVEEYRRLRPKGKVLAHLLVLATWPYDPGLDAYFSRVRKVHESEPRGILYSTDGREWGVNIGSAIVRDGLIDLWAELLRSGVFDGAVLDGMPLTMGWMERVHGPVDWARAGYASFRELEQACVTGFAQIQRSLRGMFPKATLIGNAGPGGVRPMNGWWRENFPLQNGGTWATNMMEFAGQPWGLLYDRDRYEWPQLSVLSALANPMLLMGSACLADAASIYAPTDFNAVSGWPTTWVSPYATLDRSTGLHDGNGVGWLGRAVAPAKRINAIDLLWRRDFVFGSVLVNPSGEAIDYRYEFPVYVLTGTGAFSPRHDVRVGARDVAIVMWE